MSVGNDKKRESDIAAVVKARYPGRNLYYRTADSHWYFGPSELPDIIAVDISKQNIGGQPTEFGIYLIVDEGSDYISDSELTAPTLLPRSEGIVMLRQIYGLEEMPDWPRTPTEGEYKPQQKVVDSDDETV